MGIEVYEGRVQLTDEHGLKASKVVTIHVNDLVYTTPAAQQAAALIVLQSFVSALDDIVDALITNVTMVIPAAPGGLKSVFGDQGVGEGANLILSTIDNLGGVQERPYWLPSAKAGVFLANFRTVDTADADLNTWVTSFTEDSDALIVISDGEEVQAVTGGSYATRKRNSTA